MSESKRINGHVPSVTDEHDVSSYNAVGGDNMSVQINKARCPQNHPCPSIRVCPTGALTQKGYEAPKVDAEKCIDCKKCVRHCPMGAFYQG